MTRHYGFGLRSVVHCDEQALHSLTEREKMGNLQSNCHLEKKDGFDIIAAFSFL
jgi:hypothetical protein